MDENQHPVVPFVSSENLSSKAAEVHIKASTRHGEANKNHNQQNNMLRVKQRDQGQIYDSFFSYGENQQTAVNLTEKSSQPTSEKQKPSNASSNLNQKPREIQNPEIDHIGAEKVNHTPEKSEPSERVSKTKEDSKKSTESKNNEEPDPSIQESKDLRAKLFLRPNRVDSICVEPSLRDSVQSKVEKKTEKGSGKDKAFNSKDSISGQNQPSNGQKSLNLINSSIPASSLIDRFKESNAVMMDSGVGQSDCSMIENDLNSSEYLKGIKGYRGFDSPQKIKEEDSEPKSSKNEVSDVSQQPQDVDGTQKPAQKAQSGEETVQKHKTGKSRFGQVRRIQEQDKQLEGSPNRLEDEKDPRIEGESVDKSEVDSISPGKAVGSLGLALQQNSLSESDSGFKSLPRQPVEPFNEESVLEKAGRSEKKSKPILVDEPQNSLISKTADDEEIRIQLLSKLHSDKVATPEQEDSEKITGKELPKASQEDSQNQSIDGKEDSKEVERAPERLSSNNQEFGPNEKIQEVSEEEGFLGISETTAQPETTLTTEEEDPLVGPTSSATEQNFEKRDYQDSNLKAKTSKILEEALNEEEQRILTLIKQNVKDLGALTSHVSPDIKSWNSFEDLQIDQRGESKAQNPQQRHSVKIRDAQFAQFETQTVRKRF